MRDNHLKFCDLGQLRLTNVPLSNDMIVVEGAVLTMNRLNCIWNEEGQKTKKEGRYSIVVMC